MRARVESAYEVVYAGVKLIAPSSLSASVQATSSTTTTLLSVIYLTFVYLRKFIHIDIFFDFPRYHKTDYP